MTPEDTLRNASFTILSRLQSGTEEVVRLDEALHALQAERNRIAGLISRHTRLTLETLEYLEEPPPPAS